MTRLPVLLAAMAATALTPSLAAAQPPVGLRGAGEARRGDGPELPESPALARRMLTRMIEKVGGLQDRLEVAVQKLDEGVPLSEIRPMIEEELPPMMFGEFMPDRGERRGGPRRDFQPSAEELDDIRAMIREKIPSLANRIDTLREADPEQSDRMLTRMAPKLMMLSRLHRDNPAEAELRVQEMAISLEVVTALRVAGSDDEVTATEGRAQLRAALERQLRTQVELQELEIERLETRLVELRASLEERRGRMEAEVERKAGELLNRAEKWRGERRERGGPPRP